MVDKVMVLHVDFSGRFFNTGDADRLYDAVAVHDHIIPGVAVAGGSMKIEYLRPSGTVILP